MGTSDPMGLNGAAKTVNGRYRLQVEELYGRQIEATIVNVSLQGVEELRVVLHLDALAKPLLLDEAQRRQLVQVMQGNSVEEWLGRSILLQPKQIEGAQVIHIDAAPAPRKAAKPARVLAQSQKRGSGGMLRYLANADSATNSYLAAALILLVLGLLFAVSYLIENPDALTQFLSG